MNLLDRSVTFGVVTSVMYFGVLCIGTTQVQEPAGQLRDGGNVSGTRTKATTKEANSVSTHLGSYPDHCTNSRHVRSNSIHKRLAYNAHSPNHFAYSASHNGFRRNTSPQKLAYTCL